MKLLITGDGGFLGVRLAQALVERGELRPGMAFHMPPLCLKYREFGIGFSESIVVTETGCERLSELPCEVVIKG